MSKYRRIKVVYKYDEDDIQIIETMFAGIFRHTSLEDSELEKERLDNMSKFTSCFVENIFQDEYAILYELVTTRKLSTGNWDMMQAVVDENRELILNAPQVNLGKFATDFTESDQYEGFLSCTKAVFERICEAEFTRSEHFRSAMQNFIEVFEKKYGRQCLNVMGAIMGSSDPYVDYRGGRRREYLGWKGANEFYLIEKMRIEALRGAQSSRQFVLNSEWLEDQMDPEKQEEKRKKREKLCELGISEIDSVWSGLRRTHMIGIMGPPKGGKTTLAAFMVHKLLKAGKKVAIWVMEGNSEESWINKLIALYCYDHNVLVTTKDLEEGLVGKTEEEISMVNEARLHIAQDENLSFIEEVGYVEDFLDVIDVHYRAFNKFDCIVVDSLLNLQTRTGRKKSEYLSSAYILLKAYIEQFKVDAPMCIATAQFKQDAIKDARNSTNATFDETSGGETAETERTPDEVIGIFHTPQQKASNYTTLYHIASRHSALFPKMQVRAYFDYAYFASLETN